MWLEVLVVVIVIVIIILLIYLEYGAQDCIGDKPCSNRVPPPSKDAPPDEQINRIREMLRSTYNFEAWRQCLIVALILPIPLVFLVARRLPSLVEWVIITTFIFIAVYFSYSWLWTHYLYPSSRQIERALNTLQASIQNAK